MEYCIINEYLHLHVVKKHRKPGSFIPAPSYPGGNEALKKFVGQNLIYPPEALQKGVQGTVRVKFEIDHKGNVSRPEIMDGLGYGCDEEARRIVSILKFEATKVSGLRVIHHKTLNINFRLPPKPSITYSFKPSENKGGTPGGYIINL